METFLTFERTVVRLLTQDYQRRIWHAAVQRAYASFAKRYPEWVATLFDEHFVQTHLLPLLVHASWKAVTVTPEQVARLWAQQISILPTRQQQYAVDVLPTATYFLARVADALTEVDATVSSRHVTGVLGTTTRQRDTGFCQ